MDVMVVFGCAYLGGEYGREGVVIFCWRKEREAG